MTKAEAYKEAYGKEITPSPQMDAAMEIYAKDQMVNLINNISRQPVEVYSEKVRGQDKRYFLGRTFIEGLIKSIKP